MNKDPGRSITSWTAGSKGTNFLETSTEYEPSVSAVAFKVCYVYCLNWLILRFRKRLVACSKSQIYAKKMGGKGTC